MGLETQTPADIDGQPDFGRLHLDSKSLSFRGAQCRWSVLLTEVSTAHLQDDWLVVSDGKCQASFLVDIHPDRWLQKILAPPSRLKKLGVREGMRCWVSRGFKRDFLDELKGAGVKRVRHLERAELVFLMLATPVALSDWESVVADLPAGINLWIVWPKGDSRLTRADVMATAKSLGLGPSKTAAFDDVHSSMRFARPKPR